MLQEAKSTLQDGQLPSVARISMLRTIVTLIWCLIAVKHVQAAQFVAYFPLPSDQLTSVATTDQVSLPPHHPDLLEPAALLWQTYCDTWQQHHNKPNDQAVRARLGIAAETIAVKKSDGRSTAASMRLPIKSMDRFETEHFVLLSDVAPERATEVARDIERFYLVWTQLFFPLWKSRDHWDHAVKSSRPPTMIKHRVVLFKDSVQYAQLLRAEGPGIGQSTGFYSDLKRISFFHDGDGDDVATRHHELTHQLMTEATDAKPRLRPGEQRDFWIVEGVACYMESIAFNSVLATIGGWQSSRLQFARHRVLGSGDDIPLSQLAGEGRLAVQKRDDLARWYSFSAVHTHLLIDRDNGNGLVELLQQLASTYQMRVPPLLSRPQPTDTAESISNFLQMNDDRITPITNDRLSDLCLTRTSVTSEGLAKIVPQITLEWLDLSFLAIDSRDVTRLCPTAASIEQLSLEGTRVDDSIANWLSTASLLRELDLSSTRIGDVVIEKLPSAAPIETLWLTGSRVSDASVNRIISMKSLKHVDVQRTAVTENGLAQLRTARPDLDLNPLQVAGP